MYENFISLNKARACVKVIRSGNKLVVQEGIYFLEPGTLIIPLQPRDHVFDPEGNQLKATGAFYMTGETVNPYPFVTDLF